MKRRDFLHATVWAIAVAVLALAAFLVLVYGIAGSAW